MDSNSNALLLPQSGFEGLDVVVYRVLLARDRSRGGRRRFVVSTAIKSPEAERCEGSGCIGDPRLSNVGKLEYCIADLA